jgi:3-oxoacyl-[acyl-carrier protein] reductase
MLLQGKTAVVTGASRGIGRCILETFASQGCSVFACVRTPTPELLQQFEELQARHQVNILPVQVDLADEASLKAAIRHIATHAQPVDILVNNAGVASGGLFQMCTAAQMRRVYEVNVFAPLLLTQGLVRKMVRQKAGAVINIASSAAFVADPGTLLYGSSKAALIRMTQSMATELGAFSIRVNAIAPGVTETEMLDQMDPAAREQLVQRSALKRPAQPQDVANTALYLASGLASFVSGQVVRVDGGLV